ncbi:DUF1127 domain-containing protein [Rhodovulum euryhalinum]|uniref:DUF1127 domain-containing protein n=1 Tax=Rhodovulum euryhalinum TaxID=35805 RepID=A0A4R2KHJ2_9RHOB|nr:DUF1127 domain-containing protein [Rhodovulum euryhalinum]TCO73073.1 hypothetical protein EV655_103302 [Rhodovulum euryhalinum]
MAVAHTDVSGRKGSILLAVLDMLIRVMENHPHTRQIERLNALSDEDLAARGLTRQDVIRHIFRDRYYL